MTTEQLEREAELTRAQLTASLDELRAITPGRVIDEVLGYAKSGSAELLRGLGNQVVEHPLPATLIGAGLAWLIMQNRSSNGSSRGTSYDTRTGTTTGSSWFSETGRSASATAASVRERTGSAMHSLKDSAQSAMASVGDSLDSTTGLVKEKAQSAMVGLSDTASGIGDSISDAYGTVSDTVSRTANSVAQAAASITPSQDELMQAGQRIWDYCKNEPLVLAGLGIAIGAAVGAAFPATGAENRLMGEAADQLKEKANNLAADPLDKANRVAKSVGEHVIDEAAKMAKQEVSNFVSGWDSNDGGGSASSNQENSAEPTQTGFPQSGSQQWPNH